MTADAGWYPDPAGTPGAFRYWSGTQWSETTARGPWAGPTGGGDAGGWPPEVVPEAARPDLASDVWAPAPPATVPAPDAFPTAPTGVTPPDAVPLYRGAPYPSVGSGLPPYPGSRPYAAQPWAGAYGAASPPPRRSTGAVAGIVVALVAVLGLIVGGVVGLTHRGGPTPVPGPISTTARTDPDPSTSTTAGPSTSTTSDRPPTTSTAVAPVVTHTVIPQAGTPGSVWAWGEFGLANGAPSYQATGAPTVAALVDIVQVSAGDFGGLAVDTDGAVWAWGDNYDSQLGIPDERAGDYPIQVPGLPPVKAVTSGYASSFAVAQDGTVWAWGRNYSGRLGDGRDEEYSRATPAPVEGPSDVVQVATGYSNGFALTSDGKVWAWGEGLTSGLDTYGTVQPTLIPGLDDVVSIDATFGMALALTADGTVWGWGFNADDELCIGTSSYRDGRVPTRVPVPAAAAIAAGDGFTVVALRDGTVQACGINDNGQLGNGTTDASSVPGPVPGLADIVQVSAGDDNGYAVDSSGAVWAWGDNRWHQIGDGTTMVRYSPVPVPGLAGIASVSAGRDTVYALQG